MSRAGSTGNVIAAICNVFWPGLGQLVQGRVMAALFFFLATTIFYGASAMFLFPILIALPLHLWCILNAARYTA